MWYLFGRHGFLLGRHSFSPRFYCANTSKFRACKAHSHAQHQLCRIRLYIISQQSGRIKRCSQRFWCTVFLNTQTKKIKENKEIRCLTSRTCCSYFVKKYFTSFVSFLKEFFQKLFSKFLGSMLFTIILGKLRAEYFWHSCFLLRMIRDENFWAKTDDNILVGITE